MCIIGDSKDEEEAANANEGFSLYDASSLKLILEFNKDALRNDFNLKLSRTSFAISHVALLF
jgi:hypothetical protein